MSERKSPKTSLSLFLSTALHGAIIALIALGPTFIPGMGGKGDRDSKNIEITVSDSAPQTMTDITAPAEVAPVVVAPPIEPTPVEPMAVVPAPVVKKIKKVQAKKLPEKAPENIVAAEPAVVVEESPVVAAVPVEETVTPVEETVTPEITPVAEEPVVAPAQEEPVVAAAPVETPVTEEALAPAPAEQPVVAAATAPQEAAPTQAAGDGDGQATQKGTGNDALVGPNENSSAGAQATQSYTGLSQLPGNKPPTYTREMRVKKLQGRGQLVYYVSKDGTVKDVRMSQSTGSAQLDQAAVSSFSKYKFVPGQEGYTKHDFEFSLSGPEQNDSGRLRTTLNR